MLFWGGIHLSVLLSSKETEKAQSQCLGRGAVPLYFLQSGAGLQFVKNLQDERLERANTKPN